MSNNVKVIEDNILSSKDFVDYTSSILKNKYQIRYLSIGIYAKDSYVTGEDLLSIYYSYVEKDDSYLPEKLNLFHYRDKSHNYPVIKSGCEDNLFKDDPWSETSKQNCINCYQALYNIYSGITYGSINFEEFLETKEVEISHQVHNQDPLNEILSVLRFSGLFINIEREMSILKVGVELYDFSKIDNQEARDLKLFFSRLVVTKRSKSITKINSIIKYQNIFRILIYKCGYSVNHFDSEIQEILPNNKMKKANQALECDFVRNYITRSDLPMNTLIEDLSELLPYFKNYEKVMKEVCRYFLQNNLGRITKDKVQSLLSNPGARKDLGSFFDIPSNPLDLKGFKNQNVDFSINELLSPFDLKKEGNEMGHCLGTDFFYEHEENTANNRFFSIKGQTHRSTLQLYFNRNKWEVREHRAQFNNKVKDLHQDLAHNLIIFLNSKKTRKIK